MLKGVERSINLLWCFYVGFSVWIYWYIENENIFDLFDLFDLYWISMNWCCPVH